MERYYDVNAQGHSIRCKLYCKDQHAVSKVVLFGHGFGGHKDNKAAQRFAERLMTKYKGIALITFNWPCHGDDVKKKMQLSDCMTYLELVLADIREKYHPEGIYAYATSFGGYLFLKYIHENGNPFEKISLRCPAVNMYDVLTRTIMKNDELDRIMKGKDVLVGFDRKIIVTKALLDDLKENDIRQRDYIEYADNILIMHGTKDEVVPIEDSKEFAENNVIDFITVENADHRFQNPNHMNLANKYTMEFFDL